MANIQATGNAEIQESDKTPKGGSRVSFRSSKQTKIDDNLKDLPPKLTTLPYESNPFRYDTKLTVFEFIKILIVFFTLFPIRLVVLIISMFFVYLFAKISVLGISWDNKKPLSKFRLFLQWPITIFARLVLYSLGFWWIREKGRRVSRDVAPILAANHITFVEAIYFTYTGRPMGVGKKEISKMPVAGAIQSALQGILVDRSSKDSRHDTLVEIDKRVKTPGYPQLLIFPEGTTTNARQLINFKAGAFAPGMPIQPVCISYPYHFFNVAWIPTGPSLYGLLIRCMLQFYNCMTVSYLPPYIPNEEEKKNANLFAKNIRNLMAKELGVGVTEHSYEDMTLSYEAQHMSISPAAVNFELLTLKKLYNVSAQDIKDILSKMKAFDSDHSGTLNLQEFANYLNLPITNYVVDLFHFLDIDENGEITVQEFAVGLSLLSKHFNADETAVLAFDLTDLNKDGKISREEFNLMLNRVFNHIEDKQATALFTAIDTKNLGYLTREEYIDFARQHPEYVKIAQIAAKKVSNSNQSNENILKIDVENSPQTEKALLSVKDATNSPVVNKS